MPGDIFRLARVIGAGPATKDQARALKEDLIPSYLHPVTTKFTDVQQILLGMLGNVRTPVEKMTFTVGKMRFLFVCVFTFFHLTALPCTDNTFIHYVFRI